MDRDTSPMPGTFDSSPNTRARNRIVHPGLILPPASSPSASIHLSRSNALGRTAAQQDASTPQPNSRRKRSYRETTPLTDWDMTVSSIPHASYSARDAAMATALDADLDSRYI